MVTGDPPIVRVTERRVGDRAPHLVVLALLQHGDGVEVHVLDEVRDRRLRAADGVVGGAVVEGDVRHEGVREFLGERAVVERVAQPRDRVEARS